MSSDLPNHCCCGSGEVCKVHQRPPACPNDTNGDGNCGMPACPVCGQGRRVPGVHLSWQEAVRVVPDVAATEIERILEEKARLETEAAALERALQAKKNIQKDMAEAVQQALGHLRECLLQMDAQEWERARARVVQAKGVLSGEQGG